MIGVRRRVMRWLTWRGLANDLVALGWSREKADAMVRIARGLDVHPDLVRGMAAMGSTHWSVMQAAVVADYAAIARALVDDWKAASPGAVLDLGRGDPPVCMGRNEFVWFDETPLSIDSPRKWGPE